jgi:hypothetical protein
VNDAGYSYTSNDRAAHPSLAPIIEKICQYPPKLAVKVGMRVMLKKNLTRKLVNGSCGKVVGFAEVFVFENATDLARPVSGAIMPHAVGAALFSSYADAFSRAYKPPISPLPNAPASASEVHLGDRVRMQSFCPRDVFDEMCDIEVPQGKGARASAGLAPANGWTLPTMTELNSLRANGFLPLPVVQFDNGEVAVMQPVTWSLTQRENPPRRPQEKGGAAGPPPAKAKIMVAREQIPLLPAFAVSIHSSQGLTIEHLCVDVGEKIFEAGQAYVALSRATDLNKLILVELRARSLQMVDQEVIDFYKELERKKRGFPAPKPEAVVSTRTAEEEEEDADYYRD